MWDTLNLQEYQKETEQILTDILNNQYSVSEASEEISNTLVNTALNKFGKVQPKKCSSSFLPTFSRARREAHQQHKITCDVWNENIKSNFNPDSSLKNKL